MKIKNNGNRSVAQCQERLPPNSVVWDKYKKWQDIYRNLPFSVRSLRRREDMGISIISKKAFAELSKEVKGSLNDWLDGTEFPPLKDTFLTHTNVAKEIRIVIEAEEIELRQLPWHLWNILDLYPQAEVALAPLEYDTPSNTPSIERKRRRVFAILGNSRGIDTTADRKFLEGLKDKAEIVFLVEPSRKQLNERLWDEQGWDILFFAGHSSSDRHLETGYLALNDKDKLGLRN